MGKHLNSDYYNMPVLFNMATLSLFIWVSMVSYAYRYIAPGVPRYRAAALKLTSYGTIAGYHPLVNTR